MKSQTSKSQVMVHDPTNSTNLDRHKQDRRNDREGGYEQENGCEHPGPGNDGLAGCCAKPIVNELQGQRGRPHLLPARWWLRRSE